MKWWRRKPRPSPELLEAQEKLAAVSQADQTVSDLEHQIRQLRRRNRLGPMIDQALRGGKA